VPSGADWVIAGHNVTQTIEGEETTILQMIDGEIKDGKVVRFFVYSIEPKTE
jgi:DNA-directed RNA polymerase subunit L